jgi:hypothetical protein
MLICKSMAIYHGLISRRLVGQQRLREASFPCMESRAYD